MQCRRCIAENTATCFLDLKEVLSGNHGDLELEEDEPKIKTTEKHILLNSTQTDIDVNKYLEEDEVVVEKSMYDKEWTKLEKGMKLNRLQKNL